MKGTDPSGVICQIKYVDVTMQELIYNNKQCNVLIFRDVSKLNENAKLDAKNKMLTAYNSSVSHEFLTPLKSII